jgi:hypothetical protein
MYVGFGGFADTGIMQYIYRSLTIQYVCSLPIIWMIIWASILMMHEVGSSITYARYD